MENNLLEKLWELHQKLCPSAHKIHSLFKAKGDDIVNDHIALRTYRHPSCGIEVLAKPFLAMGYQESGEYNFEAKKLYAKHYQIPGDTSAPKIFISELILDDFSKDLQNTICETIESVNSDIYNNKDLLVSGRPWSNINYKNYEKLRVESEYAAWMYAYGFCANHFTVFVNALEYFPDLESVNNFLEDEGFKLNTSGGKIKGTPEQLLEQSAIIADLVNVPFSDGDKKIPGCYYEFARRYPDKNGAVYQGFIASSADKIFESTDNK